MSEKRHRARTLSIFKRKGSTRQKRSSNGSADASGRKFSVQSTPGPQIKSGTVAPVTPATPADASLSRSSPSMNSAESSPLILAPSITRFTETEDEDDLDLPPAYTIASRKSTERGRSSAKGSIQDSVPPAATPKVDDTVGDSPDGSSPPERGLISSIFDTLHSFRDSRTEENALPQGGAGAGDPHSIKMGSTLSSLSPTPSVKSVENVKFEPVRKTLLSTLGQGDLNLDHFDTAVASEATFSPSRSEIELEPVTSETPLTVQESTTEEVIRDHMHDLSRELGLKMPSAKRQEAFHQLYPEVPSTDCLIEDFACAFRKDILVQGRLYLTEAHLSFHSNIIGLVTHMVIPLTKVLSIQKRKTLGIPNALEFTTLHNKYVFASFLSRESAYDTIHGTWSLATGVRKMSLTTVDFDVDEDDIGSNSDGSMDGYSLGVDDIDDMDSDSMISDEENMVNDSQVVDRKSADRKSVDGPKAHSPTSAKYPEEAGDVSVLDSSVPAPLGQVFNLLFGDDVSFYDQLLRAQQNFDLEGLTKFDANGDRSYSYMKPLDAPVGPKQTKCIVQEHIEHKDFDDYCTVIQTSETPNVPSGNAFTVRTRIFLNWGDNNSTKLLSLTHIDWTGKSWIKGPIEKGAVSGQKQAMEVLVAELLKKVAVSEPKPRKRKSTVRSKAPATVAAPVVPVVKQPKEAPERVIDWKLGVIAVLVVLLAWSYLCGSRIIESQRSTPFSAIVTDDDFINESQVDIWDWIESRKDIGKNGPLMIKPDFEVQARRTKDVAHRLKQQELDEVIDVLQKRLDILKEEAV